MMILKFLKIKLKDIVIMIFTCILVYSCTTNTGSDQQKQNDTLAYLNGKWGFTGYYLDKRIIGDTIENIENQIYKDDVATTINAMIIQEENGFSLHKMENNATVSKTKIEYPFVIEYQLNGNGGKEIRYALDLNKYDFHELNTIPVSDSCEIEMGNDSLKICSYSFGFTNYTLVKAISNSELILNRNGRIERYKKLKELPKVKSKK